MKTAEKVKGRHREYQKTVRMEVDEKGALEIGKRIICEDHFGTIKYVGTVPPTEGG